MHCAKCFFYETAVGDDVCNRCGRAYLPEANVYLGLLLLVTGGAAWTMRNLLTGAADPFVRPPVGLGLWATWPVSIVTCPAYGLVIGAWLAMLAAAPILTGVLYGKRGGWLSAIVVALVGPDPLMAAAAALGVWIAAGWTLRLQSKLASALVGLVPAAAYWFVAVALTDFGKGESAAAGAESAAAAARTLAPALRSMAYVPPVAAVVIAVLAAVVVVGIGAADRWHVRWPAAALAVLAAGPVPALLAFVGMDEIRYGLLLYPAAAADPVPPATLSEMDRLQDFLRRYPASQRAAAVRAHLAADIERVENGSQAGPAPRRSQEIWQELIKQNPESPYTADARLHLGDADARQGLFDQAEAAYRGVLAQTAIIVAPSEDPLAGFSAISDLFTIGASLEAKAEAEHLRTIRYDTLTHLALVLENRKGTQDNSRALALYFVAQGLKGTNRYREALQAVTAAAPGGPLADNVACDLAMCEPDNPRDLRRIEQLRKVAAAYPRTDGAMLANLAAGRCLIARAASDPGALREARQHLAEVQAELARRGAANPLDPYVAAMADTVEKELVYVQTQLRAPEGRR